VELSCTTAFTSVYRHNSAGKISVLVTSSEVAVAVAKSTCVLRRLVVLHANLLTLVLLTNAIFEHQQSCLLVSLLIKFVDCSHLTLVFV
jgi:hypothetical protein